MSCSPPIKSDSSWDELGSTLGMWNGTAGNANNYNVIGTAGDNHWYTFVRTTGDVTTATGTAYLSDGGLGGYPGSAKSPTSCPATPTATARWTSTT